MNLGKDKVAAWARYHELMLRQDQEITLAVPVVKLLDEFLCWVERHRQAQTLEWYLRHVKPFSEFLGRKLTVNELKANHVTPYIEKHYQDASPSTIHGNIRAIILRKPFNKTPALQPARASLKDLRRGLQLAR